MFRTWWCMGVAFICWAALADQGSPIGWILGMHFWTPISRLTFGVYMVHVMVIRLHYNTIEKPFDYTDYTGAYIFTSNYTLSLAGALFMYLLVEKPMANLEMLLLGKFPIRVAAFVVLVVATLVTLALLAAYMDWDFEEERKTCPQ